MLRVLIWLSLMAIPAAAAAQTQDWRIEDGRLVDRVGCTTAAESEDCVEVPLPCVGTSMAATEDAIYVTCDTGGVLVVTLETSPPRAVEIRRMLEPVAATSVKLVDGQVWVDTALGSRPLASFDRVAPPVLQPPAPVEVEPPPVQPAPPIEPVEESPVPTTGEVVEVGRGFVLVNVGSDAGLVEDGFVEFLRVEEVDLGAGQIVRRERRVGLGQVDTLNATRARVDLGLNERVPVGSLARANPEGVTSRRLLLTPPRPRGLWTVELNTRPFLALSTLGGGAILDGRVVRRFDAPVAVDLVFAPFAFGVAEDGNVLTFAGNAIVSYDTTAFQIGLGAGASRITTLPASGTDFIAGEDVDPPGSRVSFSAAQFVRLGSVDGLHVQVLNNFALFEREFVFGGITVGAQIPLRLFKEVAWIVGRGGGGVPGHIFGEGGIRILARGNGGPGSVFLTPTVGAGMLTGERWEECESFDFEVDDPRPEPTLGPGVCRRQFDYGGPLIGFGVEWRL